MYVCVYAWISYTYVCTYIRTVCVVSDEVDSSEDNGNDDDDDINTEAIPSPDDDTFKLTDSDPLVLHVLPSTVTADSEWYNYFSRGFP